MLKTIHLGLCDSMTMRCCLCNPHNAYVGILGHAVTAHIAAAQTLHGVWVILLGGQLEPIDGSFGLASVQEQLADVVLRLRIARIGTD